MNLSERIEALEAAVFGCTNYASDVIDDLTDKLRAAEEQVSMLEAKLAARQDADMVKTSKSFDAKFCPPVTTPILDEVRATLRNLMQKADDGGHSYDSENLERALQYLAKLEEISVSRETSSDYSSLARACRIAAEENYNADRAIYRQLNEAADVLDKGNVSVEAMGAVVDGIRKQIHDDREKIAELRINT